MMRAGRRVAWALVALVALALRVRHIGSDLPDFLEEAAPFRTALGMWNLSGGPTDWNPHSFVHPSLAIDLHFLAQKLGYAIAVARGAVASPADWWLRYLLDPSAVVIPARLLHVAFGVASVLLAALVAERLARGAGVFAALLAAAGPTLVATSRLVYADTVMATFALAALERMLAWRELGGRWRLAAAVLCVGLAAGTKYTGVAALVPLAWVMGQRRGVRGLAGWLLAALGVAIVFALTTPYALLDAPGFVSGVRAHVVHIAGGHLGERAANVPALYAGWLLANLGVGLGLAMAAPWLARGRARSDVVTVSVFALAFLVPLLVARYAFAYYLIPVLPALAALAAAGGIVLLSRIGRRRREAGALLGAATLLPVLIAGVRASDDGRVDTRVQAREWLEHRLGPRDLIVSEAWGPVLPSLQQQYAAMTSVWFPQASAQVRRRFLTRRWFHVVTLPFDASGPTARAGSDARVESEVLAALNAAAYDPRLLARVDYVITSGAVRDRFESEPGRFPVQCALYRWLDSTATVVARFGPESDISGPRLTVYQLGLRAQTEIVALGPLPPLWWMARTPPTRWSASAAGAESENDESLRPDGTASLRARSLAADYSSVLDGYAMQLGTDLAFLDRCDLAQPLVEGALLASPGDAHAIELYEACTGEVPRYRRADPGPDSR